MHLMLYSQINESTILSSKGTRSLLVTRQTMHLRQLLSMMLFFMGTAITSPAIATVLVNSEGDIVISGFIDSAVVQEVSGLVKARSAHAYRLVFEDCHGGQVGPSTMLAILVDTNKISTVAKKQCTSGCALAFIAGRNRTVDTKMDAALIGLHNAHTPNGEPTRNPDSLLKRLDMYSGYRLRGEVREMIRASTNPRTGVLFIFGQDGTDEKDSVRYCDEKAHSNPHRCRALDGVTAMSLGIVDVR